MSFQRMGTGKQKGLRYRFHEERKNGGKWAMDGKEVSEKN
jgi:hypothetical protein